MIFNGNGKNDLYEKIEVSEEKMQHMIEVCMQKYKEGNINSRQCDVFDIREKNVRVNSFADLISKAAVVAVSIGLSGALMSGVLSNTRNMGRSVGVIEEKTTEEATKEKRKEEGTVNGDEVIDNTFADFMTDDKNIEGYKNIFPLNEYGVAMETEQYVKSKKIEIGEFVIRCEGLVVIEGEVQNDYSITLSRKGDSKKVKIPNLDVGVLEKATFTNGKNLLYCNGGKLFKYDMVHNEVESISPHPDCDENLMIYGIKGKKIFLSDYISDSGSDFMDYYKSYAATYDMQSGKIHIIKNRQMENILLDDENYFITSKCLGDGKENSDNWEIFLERITEDGFEDVVSIGAYAKCIDCDSTDKSKIYFEVSEEGNFGLIDDSNKKIKAYDKKTGDVLVVAELHAKDFGFEDTPVCIRQITEKYCVVEFAHADMEWSKFKYHFDTKRIEKITDEK